MKKYPLVKNRKKRRTLLILSLASCLVIIVAIIISPIAITIQRTKEFEEKVKNISIEFPTSFFLYKNDSLNVRPVITNVPEGWEKKFEYQWLISDNTEHWTELPGEKNKNLIVNSNKTQEFNNKKIKLRIIYNKNEATIESIVSTITVTNTYRKIKVMISENLDANEKMVFRVVPIISNLPANYDKSDLKFQWLISSDQGRTYVNIPNQTKEVLEFPITSIELNDKIVKLKVSGKNIEECESNPGYIIFRKISDIFVNKIQFWYGKSITEFEKLQSLVIDRWANNFFEIQTPTSEYRYACVQLPFSIQDFELKEYNLPQETIIRWVLLENLWSFTIIQNNDKYYLVNNNALYSSDIKTKVQAQFYDPSGKHLFNIDVKFSFYTRLDVFDKNIKLFRTLTKKSLVNKFWQTEKSNYQNGPFLPINDDQIYIKDNSVRLNLKESERYVKIRLPLKLISEYYLGINPELSGMNLTIETPSGVPGWVVEKKEDYIEITNITTMTTGPNIFTLPMWYTIENKEYKQQLLVNCFVSPY